MTEHDLQASFFQWTDWMANSDPRWKWWLAIPNGGHRHFAVARKLKAEGVKRGVLDTFWPLPIGRYHGLWIEFKVGKNKLTDDQLKWTGYLRSQMYDVGLCYNLEEAQQYALAYTRRGH